MSGALVRNIEDSQVQACIRDFTITTIIIEGKDEVYHGGLKFIAKKDNVPWDGINDSMMATIISWCYAYIYREIFTYEVLHGCHVGFFVSMGGSCCLDGGDFGNPSLQKCGTPPG